MMNLAPTCLRVPTRTGAKHQKSLATQVRKNIVAFPNTTADENRKAVKKKGGSDTARFVSQKIDDGNIKAAIRILASNDSVLRPNDETYGKLKDKHPERKVTDTEIPGEIETPPCVVSSATVKKCIKSFPSGSAPGPDRLSPQVLKDMIDDSAGEADNRCLSNLTKFINTVVLAGRTPTFIRPYFFGANLSALSKKDNGVRPIAVGNTVRRLASKCAGSAVFNERRRDFGTRQLGYGTPLGAEAAAHAVKSYIGSSAITPDHVLLKIDFANAFNSVSRDKILNKVPLERPSIFKYTESAYGQPSKLFYGNFTISSDEGAQQGDPEGPPVFSDTINDMVGNVDTELNIWFLDDGNIAGNWQRVLWNFSRIIEESEKLGLEIHSKKCEITFLGQPSITRQQEILDRFRTISPFTEVTNIEDLVILGAPIGQLAIEDCIRQKTESLERMRSRLGELEAHHALFMIKNSFALPKLLYFLRTAPCFLYEQLLQNYDNTLQKSVEEICNITLDHISASQLHWPSTLGGLGISSAFITAPSAYLASAESCRTIIASILPDGLVNVPVTIGQAFEKWQQQSNCVERPVHPHVQSNWTGPAFKHMLATTLTLVDNNNRKRLMAFQGKEAAAWINELPSQAQGLKLTDSQLRIAVATRLGSPVCATHRCVCGSTVDNSGLHGLSCRKSAGRHARHTMVNNIIKRTLALAGYPSVLEPPGMCRSDGKRPDGATLVPWERGQTLVWDATIVDALAPSRGDPSGTAESAETLKNAKYEELTRRGHIFQAVAFTTQGQCSKNTSSFIKKLGRLIKSLTNDDRASGFLRQRLSMAIQSANAACVLGTIRVYDKLDEIFYL